MAHAFDTHTNEWRKCHNEELEELFQRPNIANEIKKRKLSWAGHAWRRVGSIVRTTIEENPVGKRPTEDHRKTTLTLGRLREKGRGKRQTRDIMKSSGRRWR